MLSLCFSLWRMMSVHCCAIDWHCFAVAWRGMALLMMHRWFGDQDARANRPPFRSWPRST